MVTDTGRKTKDDGRLEQSSIVFRPSFARLSPRTHLLTLAAYVALTLILTYPIIRHFTSEVPFGGDAWQHIWNLWWVKHALLDLHTDPYHTNLLFYPDGANLYFHTLTLTADLLGIPLQLLGFNLLATYNLMALLSFLLAGYGAFLLCHYLTRNVWASFIGGFVFAFSPYHFAHLAGHMNLFSLQWIPFYVLLLLKALDSVGSRVRGEPVGAHGRVPLLPHPTPYSLLWSAAAGVLLAINTYTDWLYGIFLALLTGLLVAWRILMPSERHAFTLLNVGWADGALRLLVGAGVFFLLVSPILLPTLREARKGYAQQPPSETLFYSSEATLAFMPSALHPLWGKSIERQLPIGGLSERVVSLGYIVLALAAFAAWKLRKNRHVRFWTFAAFATWILSLGPILQISGRTHFTDFNTTIPLPYLLIYKLPLLNIMRTPARLTVLTMLALAILVAFAIAHLLPQPKTREHNFEQNEDSKLKTQAQALERSGDSKLKTLVPTLVLPLLIAFEYLAVPFPMIAPGWDIPIYSKIASEPGQFALLELPLQPISNYMAYQTIHGKPIIGGYLSRQPPYATLEKTPALQYLADAADPSGPIRSAIAGGKGVEQLRGLGVKYVIVRWWPFTPDQKASMQAKLDTLLGRPPDFSYARDLVDVWQIQK